MSVSKNKQKKLAQSPSSFLLHIFPPVLEAPGTSLGKGWRKTKTLKAVTSIYFFIKSFLDDVKIHEFSFLYVFPYFSKFMHSSMYLLSIHLQYCFVDLFLPSSDLCCTQCHKYLGFGDHGLQFGLPSSIDHACFTQVAATKNTLMNTSRLFCVETLPKKIPKINHAHQLEYFSLATHIKKKVYPLSSGQIPHPPLRPWIFVCWHIWSKLTNNHRNDLRRVLSWAARFRRQKRPAIVLPSWERSHITLQGTNISPNKALLKMIFLSPRWDILIRWRVSFSSGWQFLESMISFSAGGICDPIVSD